MNIIKRMFHSDPNIRYARQIQQGTIHVKKREDTDKWRYFCWCLRVGVKDIKRFWHFIVIALALKVWVYWLSFYRDWAYLDGMSKERQLHLVITLPITLFWWAMFISFTIMAKNELKRLSGWRIDTRFSSRTYIVAKCHNPKFVKYRRLLMQIFIVLAVIGIIYKVVSFDWMLLLSDG